MFLQTKLGYILIKIKLSSFQIISYFQANKKRKIIKKSLKID